MREELEDAPAAHIAPHEPVPSPSLIPRPPLARPATPSELPMPAPQRPPSVRPTQHAYPDPRQEMWEAGLEYTSRLVHSGPTRQGLDQHEHASTPSGLRQPTTRATKIAHLHRAGPPPGFAPWSEAIQGDEHYRPLPKVKDTDKADWARHFGDARAHAGNAEALISNAGDASLVLGHLHALTSNRPLAHATHSSEHRKALSACVHVTGAALELAHAREALERGFITEKVYDAVRSHVQGLVTAHGLGQNEHVQAAFEADADPAKRKALRDRLDAAHGNAHRAYAAAAQANAARRAP